MKRREARGNQKGYTVVGVGRLARELTEYAAVRFVHRKCGIVPSRIRAHLEREREGRWGGGGDEIHAWEKRSKVATVL